MKTGLRILALLLALLLTAALAGCGGTQPAPTEAPTEAPAPTEGSAPVPQRTEDIVILYTNDVHAAVDENIGLAGVAAYKQEMQMETPYVALVDCGDSVQGSYLSAASNGIAVIDAMDKVGYDYRILGNHEFDYRLSGVKDIIADSEAVCLNCNLTYTGAGEDVFAQTKKYALEDYGGTKVAFIGVTTPNTVTSASPACYQENGERVVDFGGAPESFYGCVQDAADECRAQGADIVIVLGHLGTAESEGAYRSTELIAHTEGIDVVLDAHSHAVIDGDLVDNRNGGPVLLASTGTKLENIGKLTISPDGTMHTENVAGYEEKDGAVEEWIDLIEVMPFGNMICSIEITGAEILDMLECFYMDVQPAYKLDGAAVGENGSFMHLSGMKVTVDTSIPTSAELDEAGNLIGVGDTRRVTEALVEGDGGWAPIDPERTCVVAMQDYMAVNGGAGMGELLKDHHLPVEPSITDYETLINYARDVLNYDFSAYTAVEGRITIR